MAVYTEVSDEALRSFIALYGLGQLTSCKGIAEGVENTNYFISTTAGPFILTLYERRVALDDLPFFLGLKQYLHGRGVPCPLPVKALDGRTLLELSGRAAALITFLDGVSVRSPAVWHCAAVGDALAKMHLAGKGFPLTRQNALGIEGWRPLFSKFQSDADSIAPGLKALIATELGHLERAWPMGMPDGIIHADLFPDNVFFLGDKLSGLIDFYFACHDALAYDIAVCLNAWCFDAGHTFNIGKGRALLSAYDAVRPLDTHEHSAMPVLARGAALRFLLTRSFDWINTPRDALVKPHDPLDYIARLKFHQSVRGIADYGLDRIV
ncbi:MAG: homoserine kinase [Hyphomicrobium sp.]